MSEEKKNKISRSMLSFINNVVLLIAIITSAAWIIMIKYSPFNFEAIDFLAVFGDPECK